MLLVQGLFYPLELAWTRLAADTSRRGAPRTYQGLLHCLQTTARLEGVPGARARVYQGSLGSLNTLSKQPKLKPGPVPLPDSL